MIKRILVIDDNVDSGETLSVLLETLGYEARFVSSGAAGLEMISDWCPDAVICDLAMPGVNGYGVATAVRQSPDCHALLIAYTGYGNTVDRQESAAAGFHHHLTKPAHITELLQVLGAVDDGPG
jgi:CheY-like chemotaxis protein